MVYSTTEIAEKLSKMPKTMHPDILSAWAASILKYMYEKVHENGKEIEDVIPEVQKQIDV